MPTAEYQVTGMNCEHCERSVRGAVSQLPGVTRIELSASTGRLAVVAEQPIDDATVIAAVVEAGYAAGRS